MDHDQDFNNQRIRFFVGEECVYYEDGYDTMEIFFRINETTGKHEVIAYGPGNEEFTFTGKPREIEFFSGGIHVQQEVLRELQSFSQVNEQNLTKIRAAEVEAKIANDKR